MTRFVLMQEYARTPAPFALAGLQESLLRHSMTVEAQASSVDTAVPVAIYIHE